jgi:protein transport protein SEC61 subunit gamma-like protein
MAPRQGQGSRRSDEDPEFVDKAWEIQGEIENRASRIGKGKYGRVLRMARKPSREEFSRMSKITGIGMLVIGLIGFFVFYVMRFIPGVQP